MSFLLSDDEMDALREVALMGMATQATIYDHVIAESPDGTSETWVARNTTTQCWLQSNPTPMLTVVSGTQGLVNTYRCYMPVGTDIESADRVQIEGRMFVVSDTTGESTWQPLLNVSLRRVE